MDVFIAILALLGMVGGLWFLIEHVVIGSVRQGIANAQRRGRFVQQAAARARHQRMREAVAAQRVEEASHGAD